MTRINVYGTDEYGDGGGPFVGWFDSAKAARWSDADYNGNGSHGTGAGQAVYRTAQGRWVLENWTRWQGQANRCQYITPNEARNWLLQNDNDDAVTEHFGPIEEERGPGRPEIGAAVHVRLGDKLLSDVDAYADSHGLNRAETIRLLISRGLDL